MLELPLKRRLCTNMKWKCSNGSVFQTAAQTSSILTFYWDHVIGVREIVFKITKIITDEIYEPKIDLP